MHKIAIKIIGYSSLLGIICALFYQHHHEILAVCTRVKWAYVTLLGFIHIPMIVLGGLSFKFLCSHYHIMLRWTEWAGLSFVANFLNQLLPYRLGMGFRYLYMRKHFQMSNPQFIYVTLIYFIFTIVICAFFALWGWIMSDLPESLNQLFYLTCLVGLLFAGLIVWLKLYHFKTTQKWGEILDALQQLIIDRKIFTYSLLALIGVNILTTLLFYICLYAINAPLPVSHCLFLVGILTIAMLLPLTPGNIGVLEALFGTLTQVFYGDFSMGFAAIALYRVSQWIPSIILGSSFSFLLGGSIIPSIHKTKIGATKMIN